MLGLDIVVHALCERRDVDLVHAAGAGEIQRLAAAAPIAMHGPITRTLESAGKIRIDAAAGGDDVVAFGRRSCCDSGT